MRASRPRHLALDGIRGAAAVAVVLFHCGLYIEAPGMVGHGAWAVDVFFVMSGFVLDRAYGRRLAAGWPVARFAAARWVRLYPLYAMGLLLGLAVEVYAPSRDGTLGKGGGLVEALVSGVLLIPTIGSGTQQVFPLDGPCWSLFVEALANVAFALALRGAGRCAGVPMAGAGAVALVAAAATGTPLLRGGASATLWVDIARGAFGFGMGLVISRAERGGHLDALRAWPTPRLVALSLMALLLPVGRSDTWLDLAGVLVLCPGVVVLAVVREPSSDRVRRFCAGAGALSYPLYILHEPLLRLAAGTVAPSAGGVLSPRSLAVFAAAGLSLALAAAVTRWLEPALAGPAGHPSSPTLISSDARE